MILGRISIRADGPTDDTVTIGDVTFPRQVAYTVTGERGEPSLRATFEYRGGVPQCVSVHVDAARGGRGLAPGDLSLPALANLSRDVFQRTAVIVSDAPSGELPAWWNAPGVAIASAVTGEDAELKEVADVYQLNAAHHPRDAVAEHMGWSRRTASRRIAAARAKGYLPAKNSNGEA